MLQYLLSFVSVCIIKHLLTKVQGLAPRGQQTSYATHITDTKLISTKYLLFTAVTDMLYKILGTAVDSKLRIDSK